MYACGSIVTHDTARITTQHTSDLRVAVAVTQNASPVTGILRVPSLDLVYRRALGPDSDIGFKVLGGAPGIDVRQRIVRKAGFDLTIGPAASGVYTPVGVGGVVGTGFVSFTSPVLATVALSRDQSLTLNVRPGLRWLTTTSSGSGFVSEGVNNVLPLFGGGIRWEIRGSRRGFAIAGDMLTRPGRGGPVGWAVSLQSVASAHRGPDRLKRAIKKSSKEAAR